MVCKGALCLNFYRANARNRNQAVLCNRNRIAGDQAVFHRTACIYSVCLQVKRRIAVGYGVCYALNAEEVLLCFSDNELCGYIPRKDIVAVGNFNAYRISSDILRLIRTAVVCNIKLIKVYSVCICDSIYALVLAVIDIGCCRRDGNRDGSLCDFCRRSTRESACEGIVSAVSSRESRYCVGNVLVGITCVCVIESTLCKNGNDVSRYKSGIFNARRDFRLIRAVISLILCRDIEVCEREGLGSYRESTGDKGDIVYIRGESRNLNGILTAAASLGVGGGVHSSSAEGYSCLRYGVSEGNIVLFRAVLDCRAGCRNGNNLFCDI